MVLIFIIPIAFLITLIQLFFSFKKLVQQKGKYSTTHKFSLVCLTLFFLVNGFLTFVLIYCELYGGGGGSCSALGFAFIFVSPVIAIIFLVVEMFYISTSPSNEVDKP